MPAAAQLGASAHAPVLVELSPPPTQPLLLLPMKLHHSHRSPIHSAAGCMPELLEHALARGWGRGDTAASLLAIFYQIVQMTHTNYIERVRSYGWMGNGE